MVTGIQRLLEEQDRSIIAEREYKKANRKKLFIGLGLVALAYAVFAIIYMLA